MNKNELYDQIMKKVGLAVQLVLDETLTTFPKNKILNYINNIQDLLNIKIKYHKEVDNYIPDILLNTHIFDDELMDITKIDKTDFSEEEIKVISDKLQLVGYKFLTSFISDLEHLFYTPNMQNTIAYNRFNAMNYLYHICPKYVVSKIKDIGFCPKSKNSVFKYDPRIHFIYGDVPYIELLKLAYLLDSKNKSKGNNHEYSYIKIKRPNIKFYKDFDSIYGVYTKENISPDYIIEINDIKMLSTSEFIEKNLYTY